MIRLGQDFYNRHPRLVAPDLLGKILVHQMGEEEIAGRIVEVEAYLAGSDAAAHGFIGKTKRNASLFRRAGHAYVHSIHRQHCLDIVTEGIDVPSSVLIRALEPLYGVEVMKKFRSKERLVDLTSGPGKLTQALRIGKDFDGMDLTITQSLLYVADDGFVPEEIITTQRIGISKAREQELRFYIKNSPFVSGK